jgi:hypothetical protein
MVASGQGETISPGGVVQLSLHVPMSNGIVATKQVAGDTKIE